MGCRTQADGEEVQLAEDIQDAAERAALQAEEALQAARRVAMGAREGSRALLKVDTATRERILVTSMLPYSWSWKEGEGGGMGIIIIDGMPCVVACCVQLLKLFPTDAVTY